jgi:hypothetical protein
MRTHISLPRELIEEIDEVAGPRRRSEFIEEAVRAMLVNRKQSRALELALEHPLSPTSPYWGTPETTSKWVHDMRQADQAYIDARHEQRQRERERRLNDESA